MTPPRWASAATSATSSAPTRPPATAVTRTSLGLIKEDERYDLTIKLVDREGRPASALVALNLAGDPWPWTLDVQGETTVRMPPGTYSVTAYLDVNGEKRDSSGLAVMADPETVLDGSREVVLDARDARLLTTTAPQRSEDRQRKVDMSIEDATGMEFRSAYVIPPAYDDIYVLPTEEVTTGSFMLTTRWRKGEPMFSLGTPGGKTTFDTLLQPGSSWTPPPTARRPCTRDRARRATTRAWQPRGRSRSSTAATT